MNKQDKVNHLKACSKHLNGLGYYEQCIDSFEGVLYIMGTNGVGFHLHKLYKVRRVGTIAERNLRLDKEYQSYSEAFKLVEFKNEFAALTYADAINLGIYV